MYPYKHSVSFSLYKFLSYNKRCAKFALVNNANVRVTHTHTHTRTTPSIIQRWGKEIDRKRQRESERERAKKVQGK